VCPSCHGELVDELADARLRCVACERAYPVVFDIPDLRLDSDPYISIEDDREKATRLAERFDALTFRGFVEHYYATTSVVPPQHARLYTRSLEAGAARAEAFLRDWEPESDSRGALLDVGCGTAPLLAAAAGGYTPVVGVDVALRWLVVAKKRLAEAGVDARVLCACAEALPFRDQTFERVVFDSSLEHVRDQRTALAEAYRVARPGASLFVATPNRLSLGPDPQVGILAGGYLPESMIAAIVRRQGGIPPKRKLLTSSGLRGLLLGAGFSDPKLSVPGVPDAQKALFPPTTRALIGAYTATRRSRAGNWLLRRIGPLITAVAEKPAGDRSPT
jgi:SAM-dependent methyltransferase